MNEIEEVMDDEYTYWYDRYCSVEYIVTRLIKMLRTGFMSKPSYYDEYKYFIDIEDDNKNRLIIACIEEGRGNVSQNAHKTQHCAGYIPVHTSNRSVEELKLFAEKIRARLDMESEFTCAGVRTSIRFKSGKAVACFYVGQ